MSEDRNRFPDILPPILPKKGLVYQPKLLPLKSVTLEKLEKLQEDANTKVKEMIEDRQVDTQMDFDKENSPYLGHFYEEKDNIEAVGVYDQVINKIKRYDLPMEDNNMEDIVDGYREGSIIRTVYDVSTGLTGELTLPMASSTGACTTGPVRFLRDESSICTRTISPEKCRNRQNTELDHQMYIMDFPGIERADTFEQVLSTSNHLSTASTTIKYFAVNDVQQHNQLQNQMHGVDEMNSLIESLSLSSDQPKQEWFQSLEDEYDQLPYFGNYEENEMECRNIVVGVWYKLFWAGDEILHVDANILLGNVTLKRSGLTTLAQKFAVSFIHVFNQTTDNETISLATVEDYTAIELIERSGNPGYIHGKPLITVHPIEGEIYEDNNITTSPLIAEEGIGDFQIWGTPSPSGLCTDTDLRVPLFGINSVNGCFIHIEKEDIENKCQEMVQKIYDIQKQLTWASYIAKGGDKNLTEANSIEIIYEDTQPQTIYYDLKYPFCQVPATLDIQILYTFSGNIQGQDVYLVNGVKVKPIWKLWQWTCKRTSVDECEKSQRFQLQTQVEYTEIPVKWHLQNVSLFWVKQYWRERSTRGFGMVPSHWTSSSTII